MIHVDSSSHCSGDDTFRENAKKVYLTRITAVSMALQDF